MKDSTRGAALVIGAGLMGRWHASNLKRLGVPLSGVVDPALDRARSVARVSGGGPAYSTLSEALEAGQHRTAHVCTPLETHVEVVSCLLDAGIHVIAEKPLTASLAETELLLEHAARADLHLTPVHQFLFETGFIRLQREVERAGQIRHIDTVASSAGATDGGSEHAEEVMAAILPHPLSVTRRLLGPSFASAEWAVAGQTPGELRASAALEGVTAGILVSMSGRPTRNTLRVMCDGGTVHLDLFHGFSVTEPPAVSRQRKVLRPLTLASASLAAASSNLLARGLRGESAYPGLRELLTRFYRAVNGAGPNPIDPGETLDVARSRDQILALRA